MGNEVMTETRWYENPSVVFSFATILTIINIVGIVINVLVSYSTSEIKRTVSYECGYLAAIESELNQRCKDESANALLHGFNFPKEKVQ
jgi:hypothetical protein